MKQQKGAIVVFDVSNDINIKALLGSVNNQRLPEKLLFEIQGVVENLEGISRKGAVYKQDSLDKSMRNAYDSLCSFTECAIKEIHILYAHRNVRFFTQKTGKKNIKKAEIHITEEWFAAQKRRVRKKLEKKYPHELCAYIEAHSILVDDDEVVHNPYEYTATRSLVITFGVLMAPKIFIEHIEESAEKVSDVSAIRPTSVSNTFFLTDTQKDHGALVLEIGTHFTTITGCYNNLISDIQTAQFGAYSIINEIALHKQISIENAEDIFYDNIETLNKREKQFIDRKVTGYIKEEILPVVQQMSSTTKFPGGVTLIGDGAHFPDIEFIIKKVLKLYTTHATISHRIQSKQGTPLNTWESAYGFLCTSMNQEMNNPLRMRRGGLLWQKINRLLDKFSRPVQ